MNEKTITFVELYKKIYNSIIDNRKNNPIYKENEYCERHHIVPKCIGGTNDPSNLVNLRPREHYVCHLLLTKIYANDNIIYEKMLKAVIYMQCKTKTHGENRNIKFSSRLYEQMRINYSIAYKENWKKLSEEAKQEYRNKVSKYHADVSGDKNPMFGHSVKEFMTEEEIQKWKKTLSITNSGSKNGFYGKHHSEETKQKIKEANKEYIKKHGGHGFNYGHKFSDDFKRHISEALTGINLKLSHKYRITMGLLKKHNPDIDFSDFDIEKYYKLTYRQKIKYREKFISSKRQK